MDIIIYAPPQAINDHPEILDQIKAQYPLTGVIIRGADRRAFDEVLKRDLDAFWLAPGLWGHMEVRHDQLAEFMAVPGWGNTETPAYEHQFPMHCANVPQMAHQEATHYANVAEQLDATGIYATHVRYHHPANVEHIWGCVCKHCQQQMAEYQLSIDEIPEFWQRLATALASLPVQGWAPIVANQVEHEHPLVLWWAAITDSDFPLRWFSWKNATIRKYMAALQQEFAAIAGKAFFAANCFEPILAALNGHAYQTQAASEWYSPLLGYWPHHVRESVRNLAAWHGNIGSVKDVKIVETVLASILAIDDALDDPILGIHKQLKMGSAYAATLNRAYYPVLQGTTQALLPILEGFDLAEELGAGGVITQGISQMLGDDPTMDYWY